jgi:hypothetical protein
VPVFRKDYLGRILLLRLKKVVKIEWVEKEIFLDRKKIVKKNLGCCSLNKKTFELKT